MENPEILTAPGLTEILRLSLIVAAVLALPLSHLLLWLYRRALVRSMGTFSNKPGERIPSSGILEQDRMERRDDPQFSVVDRSSTVPPGSTRMVQLAKRGLFGSTAVYTAAAVFFAVTMMGATLWAGNMDINPARLLLVTWLHVWPAVLTVHLLGFGWRVVLISAGLYLAGSACLGVIAVARSTDLDMTQLIVLWSITNLPPTLLLPLFLTRRIRAVGPLVFSFTLVALTGAFQTFYLLGNNQAFLLAFVDLGSYLGITDPAMFPIVFVVLILFVGLVPFGALAWLTIAWVARLYQAKKVSEQSITLDAMWLLFSINQSVGLVFEGAWWILSGLVAFGVYKLVVWIGFRLLPKPHGANRPTAGLLLLRVFALGQRSERLFERLTTHWRYIDHVQLIAGPDLARSTVEPHEFLRFTSGKIGRLYIDGEESLATEMAGRDTAPDFDGRFRVNDFFCYADTWKMVLSSLVQESDAVLMDLRGFSAQNSGCIHELNELVDAVPVSSVLIGIDATTDRVFLEETLAEAWKSMSTDSPNAEQATGRFRFFRVDDTSQPTIQALIAWLGVASVAQATKVDQHPVGSPTS